MKVKAFAKLNLGLSVKDKRLDGFHTLNSLLCTVDIFDLVDVELTKQKDVVVQFKNATQDLQSISAQTNSAAVAAREYLILSKCDCGVKIKITKNIPLCGGMGGSSADAAGVIFALTKLLNKNILEKEVYLTASKAGSDVVALLLGGFCTVTDRGESANKLSFYRQLYFVVAKGNGADTKRVFMSFDALNRYNSSDRLSPLLSALKTKSSLQNFVYNDLTEACCAAYPSQKIFEENCFKATGLCPTLTGSGSSFFWVFDNKANAQKVCNSLIAAGQSAFVCASSPVGVSLDV